MRVLFFLVAIGMLGSPILQAKQEMPQRKSQSDQLEEIAWAWEMREASIQNIDVELSYQRNDNTPIEFRLLLNGRQSRVEQTGESEEEGKFSTIDVFDGETSAAYTPNAQGIRYGSVNATNYNAQLNDNIVFYPLLLHCLPSHEEFARFDLKKHMTIHEPSKTEDGKEWIVLRTTGSELLHGTYDYWIAADKGHSVERIYQYKDGRVASIINISLEEFSDVWLPTGWEMTVLDSEGEVRTERKIEITNTQTNISVSDEDFQLIFPEGSFVEDATDETNRSDRTDKHSYQLRPNGEKHYLTDPEWK